MSRREYLLSKEEELRRLNEDLEMQYHATESKNAKNSSDLYAEHVLDIKSHSSSDAESESNDSIHEKPKESSDHEESQHDYEDESDLKSQLSEFQSIIKFQKARIQALQEELNESMSVINDQAQELENLKNFNQLANDDTKKHSQQLQLMSSNFEKIKKQYNDAVQKNNFLEKNVAELNKEIEKFRSIEKRATKDANSRDVNLHRLEEEVKKYQRQVKDLKSNEGDMNEKSKKEIERLSQENKKLEKQKAELLAAYKKQIKLIDVLKRQKIHLEGARLLAFTEEEFLKIIELGENLI